MHVLHLFHVTIVSHIRTGISVRKGLRHGFSTSLTATAYFHLASNCVARNLAALQPLQSVPEPVSGSSGESASGSFWQRHSAGKRH
jgi:hypothetical protein